MKMHEKNSDKSEVILLIHPMLSSGESIDRLIAENIGDDYRYLLPDLASHGDAVNEEYKGAYYEAKAIHSYMVEHNIKNIKFVFGASLGGMVLFELLKYNDISYGHIFFEATSFFANSTFITPVVAGVFIKKHRVAVNDRPRAVYKMGLLYGEENAEIMADNFIAVSEESIKKMAHDCGHAPFPQMDEEMQKKCTFAYGEKDPVFMQARGKVKKRYPFAELKIWKGYGHCEKITKDKEGYGKMLREYLK